MNDLYDLDGEVAVTRTKKLSEEEVRRLTEALAYLMSARDSLEKMGQKLATFKTEEIPAMGAGALKVWLDVMKPVDFQVQFIHSFLRVSVLQQLANVK